MHCTSLPKGIRLSDMQPLFYNSLAEIDNLWQFTTIRYWFYCRLINALQKAMQGAWKKKGEKSEKCCVICRCFCQPAFIRLQSCNLWVYQYCDSLLSDKKKTLLPWKMNVGTTDDPCTGRKRDKRTKKSDFNNFSYIYADWVRVNLKSQYLVI